jgi:hypothetical protein
MPRATRQKTSMAGPWLTVLGGLGLGLIVLGVAAMAYAMAF